jgi:hydrogenase maturation protein HypF
VVRLSEGERTRDEVVTAALLRVRGLVQGVGFRPFVHRLAVRHGLAGWVRNTSSDVQIAIEGPPGALEAFELALRAEAPALARIEGVERAERVAEGRAGFVIAASALDVGRQVVSPDVATCAACEAELFDPLDRRHRYPFITCTDCGPRFSVIEAMPYDRERTTMRVFAQCQRCLAEYGSSGDRRYHSETNSCPECGPRLWYAAPDGTLLAPEREAALAAAMDRLRRGGIVAVRAIGGYHLAVDATDELSVRRLRERKRREAKPLAVMVRTLAEARSLAFVSRREAKLLESPERPIAVLRARPGSFLAPSVAPGLDRVGVMLASTPVHHLLLAGLRRPLVMTSGNRSEEPIAISNAEALEHLGEIADGFLMHDREIASRYDDSVARVHRDGVLLMRRARGWAPLPVRLPVRSPVPLLAVGPHLKNTVALAADDRAWVSQHVGDLEDLGTLEHWRDVVARLRDLFRVEPEVVARDLHPGYLSTRLAEESGLGRVIAVQHHHAHVAAVMAEHGVTEPVIGLACDGTGYGDDGTVWGCEVLLASLTGYRRVGSLLPAPLPGGDLASRRPWRAALGYAALAPGSDAAFARAISCAGAAELALARQQIGRRINTPMASSLGRLFDAAAAVLGVRGTVAYEGQAAMELEALAGTVAAPAMPMAQCEAHDRTLLDPVPLLIELGERRAAGESVSRLAAEFHESVAEGLAGLVLHAAEVAGLRTVALGGGSFQNARLLAGIERRLEQHGMRVLVPSALPPNDGAISYGQAAVAAALLAGEGSA